MRKVRFELRVRCFLAFGESRTVSATQNQYAVGSSSWQSISFCLLPTATAIFLLSRAAHRLRHGNFLVFLQVL